jgi:hypothetical protein
MKSPDNQWQPSCSIRAGGRADGQTDMTKTLCVVLRTRLKYYIQEFSCSLTASISRFCCKDHSTLMLLRLTVTLFLRLRLCGQNAEFLNVQEKILTVTYSEVLNTGVQIKYNHNATCCCLLGKFMSVYQILRLFQVG